MDLLMPPELGRVDALLAQKHYLGSPSVGDFLRQVAVRDGQWVALLVWGPAALKLKDRECWMGWNPALAAACRALPAQWQERFGYRPLLADSFTDPESYGGSCYKPALPSHGFPGAPLLMKLRDGRQQREARQRRAIRQARTSELRSASVLAASSLAVSRASCLPSLYSILRFHQ